MRTSILSETIKLEEPYNPIGSTLECICIQLICLLTVFELAGCTIPEASVDAATPRAFLQRLNDLTGARSGSTSLTLTGTDYISLRRPTAISARNNDIYLIDAGLNRIFRYDRFQQTFTQFTNLTASAETRIYTAPDRTVYITEPTRPEVLHYTWDGTRLPSFASPGNLQRPVSVSVDEATGDILVADGLLDHFISFNSMGSTISVVEPKHAISISAMATGPDGIYVADRTGHRVVVLNRDGAFRYILGAKDLGNPVAITVSRDNLIFVSDSFDQTVKVYRGQNTGAPDGENGVMVAKAGGIGTAPGSFNGIAGLAVDGSMLYVTDSLKSMVQIILINR